MLMTWKTRFSCLHWLTFLPRRVRVGPGRASVCSDDGSVTSRPVMIPN